MRADGCRRDRGSVVLLMVIVIVVGALTAIGIGRLGVVLVERQRAQSAADASALAAVTGGRPAAARLAAANGAVLVAFDQLGWQVTVRVRIGDATATARASGGP